MNIHQINMTKQEIDILKELIKSLSQDDYWEDDKGIKINKLILSLRKKFPEITKNFYMSIRILLTGERMGLPLHSIMYLLDKEKTLKRLNQILKLIKA